MHVEAQMGPLVRWDFPEMSQRHSCAVQPGTKLPNGANEKSSNELGG